MISHLDLQEIAHGPPVATPVRKRAIEIEQPSDNEVAKAAKTSDESKLLSPPISDTTGKDDGKEPQQATPGDQQVDDKSALKGKQWFNGLTKRQAQRCHLLCVRKLFCIERSSCFILLFQIA